jgi:hypothetical protein
MKSAWMLCLALGVGMPAAAQTAYRWTDEKGVTHYDEKPPAGRPSRPVDMQPSGPVGSVPAPQQRRREADARIEAQVAPSAPPPAPVAVVRGMDFKTFVRLQVGMTEGELLLRAGRPDHATVENVQGDIVKTFYYYPTKEDPFLTVITLRGGRVASIERERKFF